ncbi:MAG: hypothetical protein LC725_03150, partial [Lentisphaerae bacterium]|nr:hypothetical protein [Lentisphaerota bacterium]
MVATFTDFFIQTRIAGNELWRILLFFIFLLTLMIVGKLARALLLADAGRKEHKQPESIIPAVLRSCAQATGLIALALGLEAGVGFLQLDETLARMIHPATSVLTVLSIGFLAYCMVDVVDAWLMLLSARRASKLNDMLVPLVRKSLRITIILLTLLQIATILS